MTIEQRNDGVEKRLMHVILQCADVFNAAGFSQVIKESVVEILPHEIMVCGIAGVTRQGHYINKMLNHDYPLDYFVGMQSSDGRVDGPLGKRWRETQEPVFFQTNRDEASVPPEWLRLFNQHDLRNTIGHGVLDITGSFTSYFVFSRLTCEVGPNQAFLLRILVPHLHHALMRVLTTLEESPKKLGSTKKPLSQRQREILYWMHERKTNWEIAIILAMTELNVKYHVEQIFIKLDVRNRAHAIDKARDLGLLLKPPS
jgi:transcriptional regulator EpsA